MVPTALSVVWSSTPSEAVKRTDWVTSGPSVPAERAAPSGASASTPASRAVRTPIHRARTCIDDLLVRRPGSKIEAAQPPQRAGRREATSVRRQAVRAELAEHPALGRPGIVV